MKSVKLPRSGNEIAIECSVTKCWVKKVDQIFPQVG